MLYPEFRLGGRVHSALPPSVVFRPATVADCVSLAPRLRKEDAEEAHAAYGVPAEFALKLSLRPETFVADVEGTPEMIFGCRARPGDPLVGVPWMLGTPVITSPKWRRIFLHSSRIAVEEWQKRHPILSNHIDERNAKHIRWLRWLDFHFIARHDRFGPLGLPFLEFVRIDPCA